MEVCAGRRDHRETKILFVGDIVGGLGKRTLLALLPALRERYAPDFVVVNGENAAGGVGHHARSRRRAVRGGIDVITLGNHTYRHREIYAYLDEQERILRPANFLRSQPGHGWCVVAREGVRLGVVSLSGNLFMDAGRPRSARSTRRCTRSRARPTTCSSTCMPRPRARRSAWAGTSTAGSPPWWDPHAHPHRRRPRPAGRHRLHHRRRHDRTTRWGHRRQARAGDRVDGHQDAGPVRDLDEDPWLNGS